MQFKVPQDVLRADKIVGPLTLRQLGICVGGGTLSYGLYSVLSKQYFLEVWIFPVGFVAVMTMAFAFFKYRDLPFEKAVLLGLEYFLKPRNRTWQKLKGDYVRSVFDVVAQSQFSAAPIEVKKQQSLEALAQIVDTEKNKRSELLSSFSARPPEELK